MGAKRWREGELTRQQWKDYNAGFEDAKDFEVTDEAMYLVMDEGKKPEDLARKFVANKLKHDAAIRESAKGPGRREYIAGLADGFAEEIRKEERRRDRF